MSAADALGPPEWAGEDGGGDNALAGEYVLGLMPEPEVQAFEKRMTDEPDLRAEVSYWQLRFAVLAEDEVASVRPPGRLKNRIQRSLFGLPWTSSQALRERLGWWRGVSMVAMTAAAAFLTLVLQDRMGLPAGEDPDATERATAPGAQDSVSAAEQTDSATAPARAGDGAPSHAVQITSAPDAPPLTLAIVFSAESGALTVSPATTSLPPGRVLEIWLIPPGSDAAMSLGVIGETGLRRVVGPEIAAGIVAGGSLAVSDEPPDGSPTGSPTGMIRGIGVPVAL
ncbi:MAG: anti-sigma factor [Pseudomonadota bacterium]